MDVAYSVQPSHKDAIFARTQRDVDHIAEEVCASVPALESLGYEFLMVRSVSPALRARVNPVPTQILLEQHPHGQGEGRLQEILRGLNLVRPLQIQYPSGFE